LAAGSLGAIIGQIKSARTKRIWAAGTTDFAWQSRFHDDIIRDDESLQRIRTYIIDNPGTWTEDRYYCV
jgi:putative transposase